jgi:hypothetical protein
MLEPSVLLGDITLCPLLLILCLLRLAIPLRYLLQERILGRKLCPFPYSTSSPNKAPPAGYPSDRKWATYTSIRIRKSIRDTRIARYGDQAKSKLEHRQDKGSTAR